MIKEKDLRKDLLVWIPDGTIFPFSGPVTVSVLEKGWIKFKLLKTFEETEFVAMKNSQFLDLLQEMTIYTKEQVNEFFLRENRRREREIIKISDSLKKSKGRRNSYIKKANHFLKNYS